MKAPGARTKINIPYCSGIIAISNNLPVPRNSRTPPRMVNASVNPSPIPNPSKNEGTGYTTYRYKSEEVYRNYTIRFDENNVVDSIEWQNLVFNN